MVTELIFDGSTVTGVKTRMGVEFKAKSVILTNSTFLNGLIHVGKVQIGGGRIAEPASYGMTEQLRDFGFKTDRMKTGTPVRIDSRSVDFSQMEEQRKTIFINSPICLIFRELWNNAVAGFHIQMKRFTKHCVKDWTTHRYITDR